MARWHRRRAGHYVRKAGAIYHEVRKNSNGKWVVFVDGKGGERTFPTRLEATSALDGWLRNRKPAETATENNPAENSDTGDQKCEACNGSGTYHGAGYVLNGVFQGFSGPCFRCGGKGHQNEADRRRNWGYDQNRRVPV